MKITSVEVLLVHTKLNYGGKDGVSRPWTPILLRINTDEGIHGYGEVAMCYGVGATAGWGMAKDLAGMLIGRDPMDTERIWDDMMRKTFWGQGGGTAVFAGMSGIDMALWDIKGKALGVPVYKLLGGRCQEALRVYASQIQFGWGTEWVGQITPQQYAEAALKAVEQGYTAIKVDLLEIDPSGGVKTIPLRGLQKQEVLRMGARRMEAIRLAVGEDVDIIVENHGETDVSSAIQFGRMLEPYHVFFYEEPVSPLNPDMTAYVQEKLSIPLAAGERIYTRWGYLPFLRDRTLDVIQPDLGTCGGLSEGRKIAAMAHAYDVTVQAHVCGSPIAKAAALHFETALPNFCIHEHHRSALMAGNIELCEYDYQPENGYYFAPELPGLGQELTDGAYRKADRVLIQ